MAELTFSLAYGGPAVDDGSMSVGELAPALLALAEIFRSANATLNRDSPAVTLEINATSRGSFEVHLLLTQPDLVSQLVSFFSGDQATALANLYGIVAGAGGSAIGLFGLIKFLGRRGVVKREAVDVGSIRLELEDGVTIVIPADVLALYESVSFRREVETVVAPLNSEGVDSMEIRRTSEHVSVRIEKADLPSFRAPAQLATVPVRDSRAELALQVVAISFREGNLWRLTDGNQTYTAAIADQEFIERVARSEEDFRSGDLLQVVMRIHQEQAADGLLKTSYTIEKVLDHIRSEPSAQLRLDVGDQDDSDQA